MDKLDKFIKEKNYKGVHIYSMENIITQYINFIGQYNLTIDKSSMIVIDQNIISFHTMIPTTLINISTICSIDAITIENDIFYLRPINNNPNTIELLHTLVEYTKEHNNFKKIIVFDKNCNKLYNLVSGISIFDKDDHCNEKLKVLVTNTERLFIKNMRMKGITKTYFCNPHGMKKFEKNITVNGERYRAIIERDDKSEFAHCIIRMR